MRESGVPVLKRTPASNYGLFKPVTKVQENRLLITTFGAPRRMNISTTVNKLWHW